MGGVKNIKQEKNERSGKIPDTVERIYGGRRYMEKERNFEKYRRIN